MTDLAELKQLANRATPGPWTIWAEPTPTKNDAVAELACQVENTKEFSGTTWLLNANGLCPATTGCGPCSEANAAYIAAANPTAILALIERVERMEAALSHYGDETKWHRANHRPEVPGPVLPIMYISENGWNTENLEPWSIARAALQQGEGVE